MPVVAGGGAAAAAATVVIAQKRWNESQVDTYYKAAPSTTFLRNMPAPEECIKNDILGRQTAGYVLCSRRYTYLDTRTRNL